MTNQATYGGDMRTGRWKLAANGAPARPPGRPRDEALDSAILTAATHQLAERGYAAMSLEGVAAAASTSVPSLRRRYRGKLELAVASIDAISTAPLPAETADPRADALAILDNLRTTLMRHGGLAILAAIFTERDRHPELLAHFRQRIDEPRQERLRRALSRGVKNGHLPADLDIETVVSMLWGSLHARCLKAQRVPRDWAERTLNIIWPAGPPHLGQLPARPAEPGQPLPGTRWLAGPGQ